MTEIPPYAATWTTSGEGLRRWCVYDQREGFQPAWCDLEADNASDAAEIAEETTDGRLSCDSETLVVLEIGEHSHVWGELQQSRLGGTVHRPCEVIGCRVINAYDDDPEEMDA